jgi:AmpE protein
MLLLSLLIAVLFHSLWGSSNPLHRDAWLLYYRRLTQDCLQRLRLEGNSIEFSVALCVMSCLIIGAGHLLDHYSPFAFMIFAAVVLLYSFGRGELTRNISGFIVAMAKQDWPQAKHYADALNCPCDDLADNAWPQLNQRFLKQCNYLGFERFFAVVFWFVLLGPVGAFVYRFTQLWLASINNDGINELSPATPKVELEKNNQIQHWLWLIEWPAVRALGLSYALTGNFSGCMQAWKSIVLCAKLRSDQALMQTLLGALAIDEKQPPSQDVSRRELEALTQLQARTLWCWLMFIAVILLL